MLFSRAEAGAKRLKSKKFSICVDRALILTDAYKKYEKDSKQVLRAKAVSEVFDKMKIIIYDDELIVGNHSSCIKASPLFPEFSIKWIGEELDFLEGREASKYYVDEKTKDIIRKEIVPFWTGKSVEDNVLSSVSDPIKTCFEERIYLATGIASGIGHIAVNYELILKEGARGLIKRAVEKKSKISPLTKNHKEQLDFYDSIIIICNGLIRFANRFSELAAEMAEAEKDPVREKELREISRICNKVPEYPAESFHEALQSFWFLQLAIQLESNGHSISPGRFDQYMYPFYKNDISSGNLNEKQVEELLQCLWIKFNEISKIRDYNTSKALGGNPLYQNINLGGVDENGNDCINDLSMLCIKTTENIRMPQPSLSLRWHANMPDFVLERACELSKKGQGMPAFFNDEIMVPMMKSLGASLEEARNYAEVGCVEPQVTGKSENNFAGGFINFCKVLELIFNKGINPMTGTRILTESITDYKGTETFEDFYNVYKKCLSTIIDMHCELNNCIDKTHGDLVPTPLVSCFVDDCLAVGEDVRRGGAKYNTISPNAVGLANISDSLAVIKKKVFDEKKYSLDDVSEMLTADFENFEDTRQEFIKTVPKYGNDLDYVDDIAKLVGTDYSILMKEHDSNRNGFFSAALQSASTHVALAGTIGATPDGRKKETLLSDGGVSAAQGRDRKGVTALINSVSTIDQSKATSGTLLNVKFSPQTVDGDRGTKNLAALIKTYFEKGGQHIQFNIVNTKTLRAAQANPEEYSDLVVRVAGFSVYFVEIDKMLQSDIIARMEQNF